jgi:hypothetical protein
MSKSRTLGDDEGILITKVHSNLEKGFEILVYENTGAIRIPRANIGAGLRVIPMTAGKNYYLGRIMRYPCRVDLEKRLFDIIPGTITYIGDLYLNWDNSFCGTIRTRLADNEDATIKQVSEEYPWLFEQYSYRKHVPAVELEKVGGFEEVEELKRLKETKQEQKDKDEGK